MDIGRRADGARTKLFGGPLMKLHVIAGLAALLVGNMGCSASGADPSSSNGSGATSTGTGATSSVGAQPNLGLGGSLALGGMVGTGATGNDDGMPETCDDAALGHTYVGCDFWPTITANPVWQEFEPAVVVANGTAADAT